MRKRGHDYETNGKLFTLYCTLPALKCTTRERQNVKYATAQDGKTGIRGTALNLGLRLFRSEKTTLLNHSSSPFPVA